MKIHHIESLEAAGPVCAGWTAGAGGCWGYSNPEDFSNYEALASALGAASGSACGTGIGIVPAHMVRVRQAHTARVLVATAEDAGGGVLREGAAGEHDAVLTAEPGLMLQIVTADCVPLFLFDPETPAIGLVHSGREGTLSGIAAAAIEAMRDVFGTRPERLVCALGPSICGSCYELGGEFAARFEARYTREECERIIVGRSAAAGGPMAQTAESAAAAGVEGAAGAAGRVNPTGTCHVDVAEAVRTTLLSCGVPARNIARSPLCTFEEAGLHSYRRTHDARARNLSFIALLR